MNSHDLKDYIINNDKIEYILEELGCNSIKFHPEKNYWTATQPDGNNEMGVIICQSSYLNYFSYSRNIHLNEQRDIFYLISKIKKFSFSETIRYVHKLLGLNYSFNNNIVKKEKKDPLSILKKHYKKKCDPTEYKDFDYTVLNESILDDFVPMIHIDLFREGISPRAIKKFGLGYSYKYKRTIFPHRVWNTGELYGYNARTSIENYEEFGVHKYFLTPGMKKEFNVYGLYENFDGIKKAGYIVVGESEKSVCKRASLLDDTWVAISGHSMSTTQANIIASLDLNEIIIAMDKDVPIEDVWQICEKFYHRRKVSYIYDKHNLLGEKDSPADARNKIYHFLFKYRIVYNEVKHQEYLRGIFKIFKT